MNPWGALIARLTADPYERRWASSVWLHPGRDDVNTTALIKQQKWATDRGWRMPNTNNPQAAAPRGWDSVGPAGDSDTYRTGPGRGPGGMPPLAQPYQPARRRWTPTEEAVDDELVERMSREVDDAFAERDRLHNEYRRTGTDVAYERYMRQDELAAAYLDQYTARVRASFERAEQRRADNLRRYAQGNQAGSVGPDAATGAPDMPPAAPPYQSAGRGGSRRGRSAEEPGDRGWRPPWLDAPPDTSRMSFDEVSALATRTGDLRDEMVRMVDPPDAIARVDAAYRRYLQAQRQAAERMERRRANRPAGTARTNASGGNGMASLGEVKGQMADAEKDMEDAEKLDAAGDKAMDELVAGAQTAQQKAEEGKQNFEAAKQKALSARDKFNAAADGSDDDNAKQRAAEAQKAADDAQKALELAENARAAAEEAGKQAAAAKGGSEEAAASSSAARQGIGDYHPKL